MGQDVESESEEELQKGKQLLAQIDAMSDEDDEGDENEEWDAEARALRQAIAEGAFDQIGKIPKVDEDDEEGNEKEEEQGKEENSSDEEESDEENEDPPSKQQTK